MININQLMMTRKIYLTKNMTYKPHGNTGNDEY